MVRDGMARALVLAGLLHAGGIALLLAWPDDRPLPEPQQGAVLIWAEPAVASTPAAETPAPESATPEPPAPESAAPESAAPEPPPSPLAELPPPPPPPAPALPAPRPPRAAPTQPNPGPAAPASAAPAPPAPVWTAEGAITPPMPLEGHRNADPDYPRYARALGQQGMVRLRLTIGTDGRVTAAVVDTASGFAALDASAVAAALRWRFRPALRDGRPVAGEAFTTVVFRLDITRQGR